MLMSNEPRMQTNLTNKVALVTGASRGLGAHYAKVLSDNGAHVIVTGRVSAKNKLHRIVDEIKSNGNKASSLILDMRETSIFSDKISAVIDQFKRIDILVNNAAVSIDQPFFEVDEVNWDLHLDTNIKGLFVTTHPISKKTSKKS